MFEAFPLYSLLPSPSFTVKVPPPPSIPPPPPLPPRLAVEFLFFIFYFFLITLSWLLCTAYKRLKGILHRCRMFFFLNATTFGILIPKQQRLVLLCLG